MDLEKILEWFKKPIGSNVEDVQSEVENEVVEAKQEETNETNKEQQVQSQVQMQSQTQTQKLYNFPGAEYLTPADLQDMAVGRQKFIAKYVNFENLNSLLQTIEPLAYRQYLLDIQAGKKQGDYYTYLEKAKDLTFEATKNLAEQLRRLQNYNFTFTPFNRQQQKRPYTVRDMLRDYKKNLPLITTKYHMIYHLDDGTVDRGKLGLASPSGLQE